jgi:hypothetical protein
MATIRQQLNKTIRELNAKRAKIVDSLHGIENEIERHQAALDALNGSTPRTRRGKGGDGSTVRARTPRRIKRPTARMVAARERRERVLDFIASREHPTRARTIGRALSIPKQTVHDDCDVLETDGLVERTKIGAEIAWVATGKIIPKPKPETADGGGEDKPKRTNSVRFMGKPWLRPETPAAIERAMGGDKRPILLVVAEMRKRPDRCMSQKEMRELLLAHGYRGGAYPTWVVTWLYKKQRLERDENHGHGKFTWRLVEPMTIRPGEGVVPPNK